MNSTRREFLAAASLAAGSSLVDTGASTRAGFAGKVVLFSKHLPDAGWSRLAKLTRILGMVDWPAYFKLLAQSGFHGPISLHLEYEIGGATSAAREENTLAAAQRDLGFLRARLGEAFSA